MVSRPDGDDAVNNVLGLALGFAFCLLAASLAVAAPTQVVEGEEHCVVNVRSNDALNVRSRASASSKVETTHRYGDCGIIVTGACNGVWCPIEDGHFSGWVHSRFISMVSPALYCVSGVGPGDGLNLRAYPSSTSRVLTVLARHQCDIAFLPYAVGNWQKVRVTGYEGWAHRRFLSGE
jgi:SH3-like domain-containing protein